MFNLIHILGWRILLLLVLWILLCIDNIHTILIIYVLDILKIGLMIIVHTNLPRSIRLAISVVYGRSSVFIVTIIALLLLLPTLLPCILMGVFIIDHKVITCTS